MKRNNIELAVKRHCLDCCGNEREMVKDCEVENCDLWDYRLGAKNATTGKIKRFGGNRRVIHSSNALIGKSGSDRYDKNGKCVLQGYVKGGLL